MSTKYGLENERQSTEIDIKTEVQTGSVIGDIYNVQNRLENVDKRIESSQRITPRNRELIWNFCWMIQRIFLSFSLTMNRLRWVVKSSRERRNRGICK